MLRKQPLPISGPSEGRLSVRAAEMDVAILATVLIAKAADARVDALALKLEGGAWQSTASDLLESRLAIRVDVR